MSKVTAYYHIVFCTKSREASLPKHLRDDVYRFIWRQIKDMGCVLLRIGGVDNHIHILLNLHPTVALSDLVRNIKGRSSVWMRSDARFASFRGWASEYYACVVSPEGRSAVIEYIKNQEVHHAAEKFDGEMQRLYDYAGLTYDERRDMY